MKNAYRFVVAMVLAGLVTTSASAGHNPGGRAPREENHAGRAPRAVVFGPELSTLRAVDLDTALAPGQSVWDGSGELISTQTGVAARQFEQRFTTETILINLGVNLAAPAAKWRVENHPGL